MQPVGIVACCDEKFRGDLGANAEHAEQHGSSACQYRAEPRSDANDLGVEVADAYGELVEHPSACGSHWSVVASLTGPACGCELRLDTQHPELFTDFVRGADHDRVELVNRLGSGFQR